MRPQPADRPLPWAVFTLCIVTLAVGVAVPLLVGLSGIGVTVVAVSVVPVIARGWAPNPASWSISWLGFRANA